MQALLATARRIAPTNVPVLITGETGTGKEVLARTIHACSTRATATFLPFNCTSTPKDMLDSQLFGHRRGAFTGAVEHFPGVIRAAAGGTLFLDEIGDTSLDVQPKLLRFLESGEVHPIGETQPARVDVRVIAATNADLDAPRRRRPLPRRPLLPPQHRPPAPAAAARAARRDPGARQPLPAASTRRNTGKGDLRLAEETMEYLVLYRWPGNVRQLANEMRRLAALAETGAVLMPEHLSPEIAASRRTIPASERVLDPTEVVVRLDQPMAAAVQHLEQTMMQYALKKCGGRIEDTADDARPVAQGPLPETAAVRHRAAGELGRRQRRAPERADAHSFRTPLFFGRLASPYSAGGNRGRTAHRPGAHHGRFTPF